MGFVGLKEWRVRNAARARLSAQVKAALFPLLGLGADDVLALNEIACAEPGCPDVETVVLVMRLSEPTRAFRIRRPLDAIGPADLQALVAQEREERASGTARYRLR